MKTRNKLFLAAILCSIPLMCSKSNSAFALPANQESADNYDESSSCVEIDISGLQSLEIKELSTLLALSSDHLTSAFARNLFSSIIYSSSTFREGWLSLELTGVIDHLHSLSNPISESSKNNIDSVIINLRRLAADSNRLAELFDHIRVSRDCY